MPSNNNGPRRPAPGKYQGKPRTQDAFAKFKEPQKKAHAWDDSTEWGRGQRKGPARPAQGGRPQEGRSYGDKAYSERSYGEKPHSERSYGDKPYDKRPYGDKPYDKKPYDKKPYGNKPPYGDRPSSGRPARPAGPRPTGIPADSRPPRRPAAPPPMPQEALPFVEEAALPRENLLAGRNPIREAIKSGRDMERLLVAKGELSGSAREIVAMARERHIVVQVVDRVRLDELTEHHQGMVAFASAFRYSEVEDMLALAKEKGEDPLLVILDGVTDPHNLGAIIRSAECAGAHGVIIPERRAVGLTPAAVKASAGAVEYLPVARVGNLTRCLESLKAQGIWITAADMSGETYTGANLTGPMAIVIGAEGEGVSRLVLENSDRKVAMPIRGKIDSLNASVAAGVLLYEIRRQRG